MHGGMHEKPRTKAALPAKRRGREELRCVYRGRLAGLPQRQQMEFDQNDTVIGVYLGLALGLFHTGAARVRTIF